MFHTTDSIPCIAPNKIKQIASEHSTPFYLYSQKQILKDWDAVVHAFSWQEAYRNYFPMRENYNSAILQMLWNAGCGILACGRSELILAKRLGFQGDRLLYQPMRYDPQAEQIAVDLGAAWLVTAPELLTTAPANTIILRYAPDTASHPTYNKSYFKRVKSGLNKFELFDILLTLGVRETPVVGLELQLRSFDLQPDACLAKTKLLYSLVDEIYRRTDVRISILNPGDDIASGQLDTISHGLKSFMSTLPSEARPVVHTSFSHMILNPGSYLVSEVLMIRELQYNHLVLDASYGQFLRTALFGSIHDVRIIHRRRTRAADAYYFIEGTTPEGHDHLSAAIYSAKVSPGDLCVIFNMGCSTRSMPMLRHFTAICPEFMICTDGTVVQVGSGKSEEEVLEFLTT